MRRNPDVFDRLERKRRRAEKRLDRRAKRQARYRETRHLMEFEQLRSLVAEHGYTLEQGPESVAHPSRSVWIARHDDGSNIYGNTETIRYRTLRKTVKTQEAEKEIEMAE
jgi:hypothetical protein